MTTVNISATRLSYALGVRLIVIPLSHYCERARWALDWAGLAYREDRHLQMFHLRQVKRAGGRHTVPVLVTRGGRCLADSADIVAFADAHGARRLYPESAEERAEIEAFEAEVAGDFGVETRRLAYYELMPRRDLLMRYNNQGAPRYQALALRFGYRFAVKRLTSHLEVDAEHVAAGRPIIDETFARVGERLADGRRFLWGDAFTAADLTFASMAVPVLWPPGFPLEVPDLADAPATSREIAEHYRSLPAGQFALRLYRENR